MPFAENSLHRLPAGVADEAAVMLSDILPTGFEIGVGNGRVKPGDVVAVVGAGPVGLAAMMTAGLYGASRIIAIDLDDNRVEHAKDFGATDAVNSGGAGWKDRVLAMTDSGLGVDVAIEAVGVPLTFEMATELIRPGGTVANVGVHGESVELKLQDLWIKDVTITTGLVSATTTPMLLKLVAQGKLAPRGSRATASGSTASWTPTTPSAVPPRLRPSRWSSPADTTTTTTPAAAGTGSVAAGPPGTAGSGRPLRLGYD